MPRRRSDALPDGKAHTLFFPGCALSHNFPALSAAVFSLLSRDVLADRQTTFCCGRPLGLSGMPDKRKSYGRELCDRLRAKGVVKIVTACPNCYYELRRLLGDEGLSGEIELAFLAEVLADAGYRFEPSEAYPYEKVAFHDSCPDRHDGIVADSMRRLFEKVEIVEPTNSRRHSLCCGAGGFASAYKADLCQSHFAQGVAEFFETRAQCLVSACANCASTYKSSGAVRAAHYLELLLGVEMDMGAYGEAIAALWDPTSESSLERFEHDIPFFT